MTKGLFITATGTDVGKTYITALLIQALRQAGLAAGYYKAALSGAEPTAQGLLPGDAHYVCQTAHIPEQAADVVSYIYQAAVSPHLAAKLEGNPPELERIGQHYEALGKRYDYITVEGSGGILCPLRYDEKKIMLLDVVQMLHLPVLIVADAKLGSLNAVGLTVAYLQQHQIPIAGIILNRFCADNPMEVDNRAMMTALTGVPVLDAVAENERRLHCSVQQLYSLYREP